jgi:hypothetical protein
MARRAAFEPCEPGRHAVFAELTVHPERAVAGVGEAVFDPQPHAVICGPRDLRHDDPGMLDEVVDVAATMVVLAAVEVRLPRQLEHRVIGQVFCEIRARIPHPPFVDATPLAREVYNGRAPRKWVWGERDLGVMLDTVRRVW